MREGPLIRVAVARAVEVKRAGERRSLVLGRRRLGAAAFAGPSSCLLARRTAAYNQKRRHSALGYLTPAEFAGAFTATGDRLRNLDQLRRSPVAPPALLRQTQPATLAPIG